ncbi:MAG: hypothetical protein SWO11_22675 [Thermodesulfobacteriota bacterium]|nr:hypothetical protein [Thermodesulfobacteriota bacterium]
MFQGRYKAILVDIDEYAKELSRYIHLNPVRAKMDNFLSDKNPDKDLPALKELIDKASLKDIFGEVESVFGKEVVLGRNIKMFLCQRYAGEKLKIIGIYFSIGESGVSQACRRVKHKIKNDKKLERKIAKIEK